MSEEIKSVADADVSGKRVLVRVDFNEPMKNGAVENDSRIKAALSTLELLLKNGAAHITLMTHLGRPEGKIDETLRTAPLFAHLATLIDTSNMEMLENLRFDPREESNDEQLAKELAAHGDLYVDEAFSNAHRAHASMVGVPKLLPSYAGLELVSEVARLQPALTPPQNSLAIIGGAKFETKEPLIQKLLGTYPRMYLGGVLGSDWLKACGLPVGASMVSSVAMPNALACDSRIAGPIDVLVEDGGTREIAVRDMHADERIVDIGSHTAAAWRDEITKSDFVLWNGPMGIYEQGRTAGTDALADALVASNCRAVIGGGDTAAALAKFTFDPNQIFVSTGGGAMLEFLANGGYLPAIDVLKK
jgi:phosphoglycerate kinase